MSLQIIKHDDILFRDLLRAVSVKSVAWPYPIESQIRWIIDNMQLNDMHVFLREREEDKAYMTLSPVTAFVDGVNTPFMGVGCVCSACPGMGDGKSLLLSVNDYLDSHNYSGILFCVESLIGFYSKSNWVLIPQERVRFSEEQHGVYTMVYNSPSIETLVYSDRMI